SVAFPDPSSVAVSIEGIWYVGLAALIELKLAAGLSDQGRIKDLADVQELIRAIRPPRALGDELDPSVRSTYFELWDETSNPAEE
ncbi:MAG TPA: hypothetical protein VFY72_01015, partial [Beijerinckiaceae bacterium]|nr:hypothetical protein [Beijerinckiaceae bacterium]